MTGPRPLLRLLPVLAVQLLSTAIPTAGATAAPIADIALENPRAFPENVAADERGTLYVSNMAQGGVVRIRNGQAEMWIKPGAFGTGATMGVMPQSEAGLLWVCSNDLSAMKLAASAFGRSALVGFDLDTGVGRFAFGLPDNRADCNDIAIGPDGSVYITDGRSSRIFRLPPGGRSLALFSDDARLQDKGYGVDGIAVGPRGDLYVNTYPTGKLFRIAVVNGGAGKLTELVADRPLGTADALRHERGNRFLVVSGRGLERLTVTGNAVVVESLGKDIDGASGLAIVGDWAFVSDGQAMRLLGGQPPLLPFMLRAIPLSPTNSERR